MPKLLKHPKCKDFHFSTLSQTSLTLAYVKLNAKWNSELSFNILKVLKNIQKRSFYKSVEIISSVLNIFERNYLLQILYSCVAYVENNYSANLLKLWIDNIHIQKISKTNRFLNDETNHLNCNYYIIINLGFEYKDFSVKKESLW